MVFSDKARDGTTRITGGIPTVKGAKNWCMVSNRAGSNIQADTNILFPTVVADPLGGWRSPNASVYAWRVPIAGFYKVTFTWKANATAASRPGRILVNNANRVYSPGLPSVAYPGYSISSVLFLAVGDLVSARVDSAMVMQSDGASVDNNFLLIEPLNYAA